MYEERHVFKRSNSQSDLEFFNPCNLFDIDNHPGFNLGMGAGFLLNGGGHNQENFNDVIGHDSFNFGDKPFHSAVNLFANAIGANPSSHINPYGGYQGRNSFDFMELESNNLLEMTTNSYQSLVKQQQKEY